MFGIEKLQGLVFVAQFAYNNCSLTACVWVIGLLEKLTVAHLFQKIHSSYWKPEIYFCIYNGPPLDIACTRVTHVL
jgi:hypothetical protein